MTDPRPTADADRSATASEKDRGKQSRLILASASPRRQELLREAGYGILVHPANIDEDDNPPGMLPIEMAALLAVRKARAVAERFPDDIVLAADTVVAFGDRPLGKPADAAEAREMLALLSGTTHIVVTGVTIICLRRGLEDTRTVMSAVRMRQLTPREIDLYVAGGQWQGKAGGYGIQDEDPFVSNLAGSLSNIVGLPMETATKMLGNAGIAPRAGREVISDR